LSAIASLSWIEGVKLLPLPIAWGKITSLTLRVGGCGFGAALAWKFRTSEGLELLLAVRRGLITCESPEWYIQQDCTGYAAEIMSVATINYTRCTKQTLGFP